MSHEGRTIPSVDISPMFARYLPMDLSIFSRAIVGWRAFEASLPRQPAPLLIPVVGPALATFLEQVTKVTKITPGPFRILSAELIGYPISALYRFLFPPKPVERDADGNVVAKKSTFWKELYIVAFGTAIALYYCKFDISEFSHSLANTAATWGVLYLGTRAGVNRTYLAVAVWIFQSLHIGWAYAVASIKTSNAYDSNFLTPHCVLYLKLVALAMDYMDGARHKTFKTPAQHHSRPWGHAYKAQDQPIEELPSLFSTLGYVYFWGGFLVGPQFRYQRYKRWLTGELFEQERLAEEAEAKEPDAAALAKSRASRASPWPYTLQCLVLGGAYLAVYQAGNIMGLHFSQIAKLDFPQRFPQLWQRWVFMWFCGKVSLSKFLGTWKLTEGVVALAGLGYDGRRQIPDKVGTVADWSALHNVNPALFETPFSLQDYISSFNINTNLWTREYIYTRVRPVVGDRRIALGSSMLFLALWHGWDAGYFLTFLFEFLDVEAERMLKRHLGDHIWKWINDNSTSTLARFVVFPVYRAGCYVMSSFTLLYALIPFDLLQWDLTMAAWRNLGWVGHWEIAFVFAADGLLNAVGSITKKKPSKIEAKKKDN
ncbi:MBOAT-domain-containing protein [Gonapodya prolifera JEL478]|uniref:Lysophospholipid acyltransferase 5 n=1 Tax=Gonapodya prolifera (strain JEL478) TaxID=1344416 RepID=A0A139AUD4_GONPJ|nr:MBOAT-domain-containing protein [Gonapodya prolifera JEL478]|eukprot:KXS20314.1 MBOAT-domain-containing protein [Gonapodya prolifera JEL478]